MKNIDLLKEALLLGGMEEGRDFLVSDTTLIFISLTDRGQGYFKKSNFDFKKLRTTKIIIGDVVIKKDYGPLTIEILHLFKLRDNGETAEFTNDTVLEFEDQVSLDPKIYISYFTVKFGSLIKQTNGSTYFLRIRTKDLDVLKTYKIFAEELGIKVSDIKVQQQKELYYYIHVNVAEFKRAGLPFDYFKILNKS